VTGKTGDYRLHGALRDMCPGALLDEFRHADPPSLILPCLLYMTARPYRIGRFAAASSCALPGRTSHKPCHRKI
jgi:hypothetical protein